jgi:hypothetical protein
VSDDYGLTVIEMSFRNVTVRHARSGRVFFFSQTDRDLHAVCETCGD